MAATLRWLTPDPSTTIGKLGGFKLFSIRRIYIEDAPPFSAMCRLPGVIFPDEPHFASVTDAKEWAEGIFEWWKAKAGID